MRRYSEGELRPQPVIVATGNSSRADKLRYQRCGFDGILSKPMNHRTLTQWVGEFYKFRVMTHEEGRPGGAVQVHPMKTELKAPRTNLLTLEYDEPL